MSPPGATTASSSADRSHVSAALAAATRGLVLRRLARLGIGALVCLCLLDLCLIGALAKRRLPVVMVPGTSIFVPRRMETR